MLKQKKSVKERERELSKEIIEKIVINIKNALL